MEAKTGASNPWMGLRGRLTRPAPVARANGNGNGNGKAPVLDTDDPAVRLDEHMRDAKAVVLHHRRLGDGEISHLIVGPAGVTVIDSRNYTSRRVKVGHGGLRVGRRNRSDLVRDALAQADAIQNLLADTPYENVPVEAALAWREVEGLPILHTFNAPRVLVCGTGKIAKEASRRGPLPARKVDALASYLEGELTAA